MMCISQVIDVFSTVIRVFLRVWFDVLSGGVWTSSAVQKVTARLLIILLVTDTSWSNDKTKVYDSSC